MSPDLTRARLLLEVDRPAEAVPLLHRALAEDPTSLPGWLLLSAAQCGLGRPGDALEAAGRAAGLAPDAAVAHLAASRALSDLGRHDEAVQAARVAARLDPEEPESHCALARALLLAPLRGREAWDAAAQAARLAPDEPEPHAVMGSVALVTGHHEVADAAFRRVLALRPDDPAARHGLGLAAAAAGRDGVAMSHLGGALAGDPTLGESRQVLVRLWDAALVGTHVLLGSGCLVLVLLAGPAVGGEPVPRGVLAVAAGVTLAAVAGRLARLRRRLPARVRPALAVWARGPRSTVSLGCLALAALAQVGALALPAAAVAGTAAAGLAAAVLGGVAVATRPGPVETAPPEPREWTSEHRR